MLDDLFPFTIRARDNGHFIWMDHTYRETWLKIRPKDYIWKCYDVTIKSPTEIMFTIYGMRDMCWGGIGDKQDDFDVTVDDSLTYKSIVEECESRARAIRRQQIQEQEQALIDEIKWTIYNTHC